MHRGLKNLFDKFHLSSCLPSFYSESGLSFQTYSNNPPGLQVNANTLSNLYVLERSEVTAGAKNNDSSSLSLCLPTLTHSSIPQPLRILLPSALICPAVCPDPSQQVADHHMGDMGPRACVRVVALMDGTCGARDTKRQ